MLYVYVFYEDAEVGADIMGSSTLELRVYASS